MNEGCPQPYRKPGFPYGAICGRPRTTDEDPCPRHGPPSFEARGNHIETAYRLIDAKDKRIAELEAKIEELEEAIRRSPMERDGRGSIT